MTSRKRPGANLAKILPVKQMKVEEDEDKKKEFKCSSNYPKIFEQFRGFSIIGKVSLISPLATTNYNVSYHCGVHDHAGKQTRVYFHGEVARTWCKLKVNDVILLKKFRVQNVMSMGEHFLQFEINLDDQSEILIVKNAPNFDIDPYIEFTPISGVQNVGAEVKTINLRGYFHSIAPAVWKNGEKGGYPTRVVMIRQGTSMLRIKLWGPILKNFNGQVGNEVTLHNFYINRNYPRLAVECKRDSTMSILGTTLQPNNAAESLPAIDFTEIENGNDILQFSMESLLPILEKIQILGRIYYISSDNKKLGSTTNEFIDIHNDDGDTVRISFWSNQVQVEKKLKIGDVICLSKFYIKPTMEGFNVTTSSYEIVCTENTVINVIVDYKIKSVEWQTNLETIADLPSKKIISVTGKILSIDPLETDYNAAGSEIKILRFSIIDDNQNEIPVVAWNEAAKQFKGYTDQTITLHGVKINTYESITELRIMNSTYVTYHDECV